MAQVTEALLGVLLCYPPLCDGSFVFPALGSCVGGADGYFGTDMLKMAANFFSPAVYFLQVLGWGWIGMGYGGPP